MSRVGPKNAAISDQIVAILRSADGFPMSTGEIGRALGQHLKTWSYSPRPRPARPQCWSEDVIDPWPDAPDRGYCEKCNAFHRCPVWRTYDAADIRSILNRLARSGEIEKVVLENQTHHYWRRDDSDCDVNADV